MLPACCWNSAGPTQNKRRTPGWTALAPYLRATSCSTWSQPVLTQTVLNKKSTYQKRRKQQPGHKCPCLGTMFRNSRSSCWKSIFILFMGRPPWQMVRGMHLTISFATPPWGFGCIFIPSPSLPDFCHKCRGSKWVIVKMCSLGRQIQTRGTRSVGFIGFPRFMLSQVPTWATRKRWQLGHQEALVAWSWPKTSNVTRAFILTWNLMNWNLLIRWQFMGFLTSSLPKYPSQAQSVQYSKLGAPWRT